jgi:cell shape-determining protein MreC
MTAENIQRQVDQLEGKIDTKLDSFAREVRVGMEGMVKVLDERWRGIEQRFDMSDRQQQQNIELLSSNVQIEQRVTKTELDGLKEDLSSLKENLKWIWRALAGAVISVVVYFVTTGHHP